MRLLQVSFDSIENTFYRQHIPQVTDRDEVALRYLSDVKVTYTDKRAGLCEPQVCGYLTIGLFCTLKSLSIGLFYLYL